jgi:hypothetical protein
VAEALLHFDSVRPASNIKDAVVWRSLSQVTCRCPTGQRHMITARPDLEQTQDRPSQ